MTDLSLLDFQGRLLPVSAKTTKSFIGTSAKETLVGTAGNDGIRSGGGGDTLIGGAGDDTYFVDGRADTVIERQGEGVDTVVSTKTFVLPDWVENLTVTGAGAHGQGNGLANVMKGGDGSQSLDGGAGNDVLTGGAGADVFVVWAGNGSDAISDFKGSGLEGDKIRLGGTSLFTFDQVKAAMTQVGSDVVLRLSATETLTIRNTTVSGFTAADFQLPMDYSTLKPTFTEEFDSLTLWNGTTGWRPEYGWGGAGTLTSRTLTSNKEMQIYVDPAFKGSGTTALGLNPFSTKDGILTITARPTDPALASSLWNYQYTSGLLTTKFMHEQTYGFFEMRAQLPEGKGLWPAFWLLPSDGSWPPELDVMEMLGHDTTTAHTTLHTKESGTHTSKTAGVYVADASKTWHTYGAKWTATEIVWYVDGVEVFRAPTPADMHKPMYMLINLAVGGSWPGAPDASTLFPAEMKVDWVRAYAIQPPTSTPTPAPVGELLGVEICPPPPQDVTTTTAGSVFGPPTDDFFPVGETVCGGGHGGPAFDAWLDGPAPGPSPAPDTAFALMDEPGHGVWTDRPVLPSHEVLRLEPHDWLFA